MINDFRGRYRFLSNFAHANVTFDGIQYPTVEHAYQAAKSDDPVYRMRVWDCLTPGEAKRVGKSAKLRKDWGTVRLSIMYDLVKQKFQQPAMRNQLLSTVDEELVEGNYWVDYFWGVC